MVEIISRMYGDAASVDGVLDDLYYLGILFDGVVVTRPGGTAAEALAAILKGHVPKSIAPIYAEGVARGGTLISVAPPFGAASAVLQAMTKRQPIDSGYNPAVRQPAGFDEAAPFSDLLGLPVLSGSGRAGTSGLPLAAQGYSIPIPQLTRRGGTTFPIGRLPSKPSIPIPQLTRGRTTFPIGRLPSGPSIPIPQLIRDRGGYSPVIPLPTLARDR